MLVNPGRITILALLLALLSSHTFAQSPSESAGILQSDGSEVRTLNIKSCNDSRLSGVQQATLHHSSAGWFWGGVGSGLVLGPIGAAAITLSARSSSPIPPEIPQDVSRQCFLEGYDSKARRLNVGRALCGGLIGTAILTAATVYSLNHMSPDLNPRIY